MAEDISENKSIPLRGTVLLFLALSLLISVITALNFLGVRGNFPSWFGPVFLVRQFCRIGLFICIICFYIWQLPLTLELVNPPAIYQTVLIWLLLVLSVICTSALHQFAPFRLDAIMLWPQIRQFCRTPPQSPEVQFRSDRRLSPGSFGLCHPLLSRPQLSGRDRPGNPCCYHARAE